MNLNPRVGSYFRAAVIRPMLPSLMRSGRSRPRPWYCLATLTTKRRLASTRRPSASASPSLMRQASEASSSGVVTG